MAKPYRQLAIRMTVTALAVALIPLYLLGAAIYIYFSNVQEEQLKAEMRNLAVNRVNAISLFLEERTMMIEVLTKTSSLDELTAPKALENIFELLNRRSGSFLDLGIIDSEGNHRVYVGPYKLEEKNYSDSYWFQQTMLRGVYISEVFLGFRGAPHFVVAVKHGAGAGSWVLRATIDSKVFTSFVQSAQLGQRGDAYIVNLEGKYQTSPRFSGSVLSDSRLDVKSAPRGVSFSERTSAKGRRLITVYAWLPKKDWLLVIERDPRETLGPLIVARNMELAIIGFGSLLIIASIIVLVRLMVGQLEAQDQERLSMDARLAHSARLVSLGRMAAGVAHEINNPLATIGELSGLLEDIIDEEWDPDIPNKELFIENLTKIGHHVERARNVTHRLLGFARRMEPFVDSVGINMLLEEAFSFVAQETGFRNIEVVQKLDPNMPEIKSDKAQLQQVFLNILQNAIDAVEDGGKIIMETKNSENEIDVIISDNGPGVPVEFQKSIFDPFFTTKKPGIGTGLGLSISYTIVQNLGGTLTFKSKPGRGTSFFIRIPKAIR